MNSTPATGPATTTAWVARGGRGPDDEDAFTETTVEVPAPEGHDLRVRVAAVSVNPVDTKVHAGLAEGTQQLGWDASGVVESVGSEVTRFAPGDEVYYAGDLTRPGTDAGLHLVDERVVGRKPATLDHAQAASLPLTAITAWETLFDRFGLAADSTGTLLVVGGAGGVGSVLVQLARQLTGLTVVATAGREESRAWVEGLGAHHVVDRRDLVAAVGEVAPDGVDLVFTAHSAGNVEAFAEVLRPFGEVVAIDDPEQLDLLPLKGKSIAWHWELMFTRSMQGTADLVEQGRLLDRVADLVDDGTLRHTATTVVEGLDATTLREAHRRLASGSTIGKVVLTLRG
ncbi:zinc-binding alcohol dehydrogenase family protein [Nocardioides sp. AX2bis]|uniref:zinc-binding alcohol dehydrogenase family protein n=1 Tax=Nocardioides sp. AX2bis TaxID=2653157 RepID=UPI0012F3E64A|nr:zinc-binding alcohol dehydrogenase family protein [Nocardioides sp. AX2bis]VXB79540.1 Zinc-type alcohol dehydrogenase-like protein [Nocardioides sp. AX2bis]